MSHNSARFKADSQDASRKNIDLHDVITLIKSVLNKTKNQYCCNIFLEKCWYE